MRQGETINCAICIPARLYINSAKYNRASILHIGYHAGEPLQLPSGLSTGTYILQILDHGQLSHRGNDIAWMIEWRQWFRRFSMVTAHSFRLIPSIVQFAVNIGEQVRKRCDFSISSCWFRHPSPGSFKFLLFLLSFRISFSSVSTQLFLIAQARFLCLITVEEEAASLEARAWQELPGAFWDRHRSLLL